MTRTSTPTKTVLTALLLCVGLAACATLGGAAIGAGIGAATGGDAKTGALIGGTAGAVVDIFGH